MLIQRPVKQFGFRTYTDDFAAAPLNPSPPPTHLYEIQTAEMDGDLDLIYALVNGGLQNDNLAPDAAIAYSKLNLTGQIVNADVSPTAAIVGSKLADVSVPTGKLVVGATTPMVQTAAANVMVGFAGPQDVCVLPAITTRGGLVQIGGSVALVAVLLGSGGQSTVTLKIYRDATPIFTVAYTLALDTAAVAGQFAVPTPFVMEVPAAGTYVYKLTAEIDANTLKTSAAPGSLYVVEFA